MTSITWKSILPIQRIVNELLDHVKDQTPFPNSVRCYFGCYTKDHEEDVRQAVQKDPRPELWCQLFGDGKAIQSQTGSSRCFLTLLDYNLSQGTCDRSLYHPDLQQFCQSICRSYASSFS